MADERRSARRRAQARWRGAPTECQASERGLACNRDRHPGREHFDSTYGRWYEKQDTQPRAQFCDIDWQDRFTANPDAPAFYNAYEVGQDHLFTVGTVGGVHMTKKQYPVFVESLRKWADAIEGYMKDYDDEGKV